jgi:hypothetical protein
MIRQSPPLITLVHPSKRLLSINSPYNIALSRGRIFGLDSKPFLNRFDDLLPRFN